MSGLRAVLEDMWSAAEGAPDGAAWALQCEHALRAYASRGAVERLQLAGLVGFADHHVVTTAEEIVDLRDAESRTPVVALGDSAEGDLVIVIRQPRWDDGGR